MTAEAVLARLRGGDPAGALAHAGCCHAARSADAASLVARGMVQLANDHPAEALSALRTAVALGDTMPATLLNLAMAEEQAGDAARAMRLMEAWSSACPTGTNRRCGWPKALRAAGRLRGRRTAYRRVLADQPAARSGAARAGRPAAHARRRRGRARAAVALLRHCARTRPMRGTHSASRCCGPATRRSRKRHSPRRSAWRREVLEYALHRVDAAVRAGTGRERCWPGLKPRRRSIR